MVHSEHGVMITDRSVAAMSSQSSQQTVISSLGNSQNTFSGGGNLSQKKTIQKPTVDISPVWKHWKKPLVTDSGSIFISLFYYF
jgi:hypothetical protein